MLFQKSQYDAARVVKENKTSQIKKIETEPSGKIETQVLIQGKYFNANRRKDFGLPRRSVSKLSKLGNRLAESI